MKPKLYNYVFANIYALYVDKIMKKGRTKDELNTVIFWLTGYDEKGLQLQMDKGVDLDTFFAKAPQVNPCANKITGKICGIRVEDIADPLTQKIRWLDKLVDELAKGKAMEKVLRG